jgi:hypothetical protein
VTEYGTVEGVQVLSTGMRHRGMTGVYHVTAEHLADMVAAQDDPLIRAPRVKLGHTDVLFGALAGSHDPAPGATDGQPGFGTLTNLRLAQSGAMLVADLAEVPAWLIDAMPSAYPTRSAEWIWDHETAGGKRYAAVLTDLALGGVWEPAVEDLADVTREQAAAALQALLEAGPQAALDAVREAQVQTTAEAAAAFAVASAL